MSEPMDELQLQRLVDGELNETECRRLLARLDGVPNEWRRVALAYVEQQLWATACRGEVRPAGDPVGAGRQVTSPPLSVAFGRLSSNSWKMSS